MKKRWFLAIIAVFLFFACSDGGSINSDTADLDIFVLDISEETDWNYVVVGNDGSSIFFNVNGSNDIPTELYFKPDKNSDKGSTILLKENGLPDIMINNGHILYFGNFNDYKFDLAIIYPNNTIEYHYDIETDVNWNTYNRISVSNQARFIGAILNSLNYLKPVLPVVICGVALFYAPATGACAVSVVSNISKVAIEKVFDGFTEDLGKLFVDTIACASGSPFACLSGLAGSVSLLSYIDMDLANQKTPQISQAGNTIDNAAKSYYYVTFDANGGRGVPPSITRVNAGSNITLPNATQLMRDGYTFAGWNTRADGTGANYNAGSSYKPTSSIILYAKWNVSNPGGVFVAVTGISGVPTSGTAGTALTLSGTVSPSNATNRTIAWSVKSAGTTGATISGSTLNTTAVGIVTVTATIANGVAQGTPYTQDFTITISVAAHNGTPGLAFTSISGGYSVSKGTVTSGAVVIPSTYDDLPVKYIDRYAFSQTSITSVTISSGVTQIGIYAFENCTSLTSITIPSSVTSIGEGAFENCTSLTSITIPSSVTYIGEGAFLNCTSLTSITIPSGVTVIKSATFYSCLNLTSITIPSSVTTIDAGAFAECTRLTSITIPAVVTSIGRDVFSGWGSSQTINIQGRADQAAADAAWGSAWRNDCNAVINYSGSGGNNPAFIPVTNISGVPTSGTAGTALTLSGTVSPSNATNKTIAWSVKSAGTTGASVVQVGGATGTSVIESALFTTAAGTVIITATIANGTAQGTPYTQDFTITISASTPEYDGTPGLAFTPINNNTAYSVTKGTVASGAVVIPAVYNGLPVTEIADSAFSRTNITSVSIPSSITDIGQAAFLGCTGLTSITIPSSVTHISWSTFTGCTGLTSVTIPSSVTSIAAFVFQGCTSITSIIISSSVTTIGSGAFIDWTSSQTIYIQGKSNQAAADAVWGSEWRRDCNAQIIYQG